MLVSDLIKILHTFAPHREVAIIDADTGWHLPVKYVGRDLEKINQHAQHNDVKAEDMDDNRVYLVSNYLD